MSFCDKCGAPLPENAQFCPVCGKGVGTESPTAGDPLPGLPQKPVKKRRLRRILLIALALLTLAALPGRLGKRSPSGNAPSRTQITLSPAPTAAPTPTDTPAPAEPPAADGIRPEVKEFLDSYEAFMDEYISFMAKYVKAGAGDMASMLGEYYDILTRYSQFTQKVDALGKEDLNNAELAYYLEVTGRVSQKLLAVMG